MMAEDLHLIKKSDKNGARYIIYSGHFLDGRVVWSRHCVNGEDCGGYNYPADVRAKYEELSGKLEFDPTWDGRDVNLVEVMADESVYDQPCHWGNRVEDHAVYCANGGWLYSPRKCRRTWYTGGAVRDEDCPGFKRNAR
jgi:hypothetical protein